MRDRGGLTPACFAAAHGRLPFLQQLWGLGTLTRDCPLLGLAARGGHLETVDFLLEQMPPPKMIGRTIHVGSDSPIHAASRTGHDRVVKRLIESGESLSAMRTRVIGPVGNTVQRPAFVASVTPLADAVLEGSFRSALTLMESGASGPEESRPSVLALAVFSRHLDVVRLVLPASTEAARREAFSVAHARGDSRLVSIIGNCEFEWGPLVNLELAALPPEATLRLCAVHDLTIQAVKQFGPRDGKRVWAGIERMLSRGTVGADLLSIVANRLYSTVIKGTWARSDAFWSGIRMVAWSQIHGRATHSSTFRLHEGSCCSYPWLALALRRNDSMYCLGATDNGRLASACDHGMDRASLIAMARGNERVYWAAGASHRASQQKLKLLIEIWRLV